MVPIVPIVDGTDDLDLELLRLLVGFHFAPPDTSLSVLESSYQCVVGLTVTVEVIFWPQKTR